MAVAVVSLGALALSQEARAQPAASIDTCADGAVNGLITVSIAAAVALFAEVALPAYPLLFTIGPAVGCPVRIIGEGLKSRILPGPS